MRAHAQALAGQLSRATRRLLARHPQTQAHALEGLLSCMNRLLSPRTMMLRASRAPAARRAWLQNQTLYGMLSHMGARRANCGIAAALAEQMQAP